MEKRLLAALLVICTFLGSLPFALAEGTKVYIIANNLKILEKASSSAKNLGTMAYGQSLICLDVDEKWAKVENDKGQTGYCRAEYLSEENPNTLDETIYIKENRVNVYRRPTTSSDVMMELQKNDSYTCVAVTEDGKWARLKNGKYYGYVKASQITAEEPEQETKPVIPDLGEDEDAPEDEEDVAGTTVYIASNTLKAYKKASSSSTVLGTMSFGERMKLLALDDDWAKIENPDGDVGWCKFSGLTTKNPNTLDERYYLAKDGVSVYAKPSTSAKVLATGEMNDRITVVAITNDEDWLRVERSGGYGYVQAKYASKSKVEADEPEEDKPDEDEPEEDEEELNPFIETRVYVVNATLKVYKKESTSSTQLVLMSLGEKLTLTGLDGSWAQVRTGGGTVGYCKYEGLSTANPNKYDETLYAKGDGVKLYKNATTDSEVLSTADINTKLTGVAISPDGDWIRVKRSSGYAYVRDDDVSKSKVETRSDDIEDIIDLAKDQLGKKYVYGADGPNYFDCSSLTQYCFKKAAGVSLSRTAQKQGYENKYEKISSTSDLRRGDLVFFNTNDSDSDLCDHVGIYLGSREFIHASSAAEKVIISSLSSGYYKRTFSWGRRVFE